MLRRLISGLSTSRSLVKSSRQLSVSQEPFYLYSRRFTSSPAPPDPSKGSGSLLPKAAIGAVLAGVAVAAAYQSGYLNNPQFKQEESSISQKPEIHQSPTLNETYQHDLPRSEEKRSLEPDENESLEPGVSDNIGKDDLNDVTVKIVSDHSNDISPVVEDSKDRISESETISVELFHPEEEKSGLPDASLDSLPQGEEVSSSEISSERSVDAAVHENDGDSLHLNHAEETVPNETPISSQTPSEEPSEQEHLENIVDKSPPVELESFEADKERAEILVPAQSPDISISLTENKEVSQEVSGDSSAFQDQKIIVDFIDAIHAAEIRQAESDHRLFSMEKQKMKGKYEKELRDARARELMFAEEAAILDKELSRERMKAEATTKLLEERAEENLKAELHKKEEERNFELKKLQELAKAELNAAIAKEKASHLEQMSEANFNISALCMAFYARSEEARQNYSVHKLALGALALENALSKGLPIKAEIDSLQSSISGLKEDSLLDLVLASLPEEALANGTDTLLQLNQKFDSLKGTLRHFSLIPLGGGGILTHAVAHFASAIKMRENNSKNGEGIESAISRVESLLAEGNLAEAADVLEREVTGTEAEGVVREWVKLARHRAIADQAISLLQAYASSSSLS